MNNSSLRQHRASSRSSRYTPYPLAPRTTDHHVTRTKSTNTPHSSTTLENTNSDGRKTTSVRVTPAASQNISGGKEKKSGTSHIPMRKKLLRWSKVALRESARALDGGNHMVSVGYLTDWVFIQGALHALDGTFDFDVTMVYSMIRNELDLVGRDPHSAKGCFTSPEDVFQRMYNSYTLSDHAGHQTWIQLSETGLWEDLCEELEAAYSASTGSLTHSENSTGASGTDAKSKDSLRDASSSPPARSIVGASTSNGCASGTSNGCASGTSMSNVVSSGIADPNPSGSLFDRIKRLTVAVSNETHRALQSGDVKLWARCAVGYAHLEGALQGLDQTSGFDVKSYVSTIHTLARGAGCDVERLAPVFTSIEDVFTYLIIHPSVGAQETIDKALPTLLSRPCERRATQQPALIDRISPSTPAKLSHRDTHE